MTVMPNKKRIDENALLVEIERVRGSKRPRAKIELAFGKRLKEARAGRNLTQDALAKQLTHILEVEGTVADDNKKKVRGRSSIAQWETGRAFPEFTTIRAIARAVNKSPEYLAFGITGEPKVVAPDPEELGYVLAPEIKIINEHKHEEVQKWGLPLDWLRGELGVTSSYKDIAIYKVEVNGDPFEYGDRVIIDRNNFKPSPPGHFLYWDGVGANIAKMRVVPSAGKKHIAKISAPDGDFEVDVDKLSIIGRVKGVWKKA